jgi:hypothetical protein
MYDVGVTMSIDERSIVPPKSEIMARGVKRQRNHNAVHILHMQSLSKVVPDQN